MARQSHAKVVTLSYLQPMNLLIITILHRHQFTNQIPVSLLMISLDLIIPPRLTWSQNILHSGWVCDRSGIGFPGGRPPGAPNRARLKPGGKGGNMELFGSTGGGGQGRGGPGWGGPGWGGPAARGTDATGAADAGRAGRHAGGVQWDDAGERHAEWQHGTEPIAALTNWSTTSIIRCCCVWDAIGAACARASGAADRPVRVVCMPALFAIARGTHALARGGRLRATALEAQHEIADGKGASAPHTDDTGF